MIAEHIVSSVCNRFGITRNELRSQSRKSHLVDARQTCAIALRKFGCTYEYIGNVINRKDHTTIMHLLKHRLHNIDENQRIANETVNAYKDMAVTRIGRKKLNMEQFLEMVQQTK